MARRHRCGWVHQPGTPCADGRVLPTVAELLDRDAVREWDTAGSMQLVGAAGSGRAGPARRARADRRWSDPVSLVVATDRRGGCTHDDESLAADGVDTSGFDGRLTWNHDRNHAIGRVDAFAVEGERLVALARLDCSTDRGRRLVAEHQAGEALHASVGYVVLDRDERWWPRVTRWRLTDVALVSSGAGLDPGAVTAAWRL